jgi:4-hydroxy-4-methyl-2-oxoglutarate aldolase
MLKDPPLLTVRRMWQRPDAFTLGRLKGVQTGQAVDAMQGRGALDAAIKAIDPGNAFFLGTALPCETGPNDNLAILAAVALAQPGDVIMAASEGFAQSAVVGDNVTMVAKGKGAAAIVIDGMARDIAGIAPVGLPVFARGITPNSCVRSGPGRVGLPIVIGGVSVEAGDVVIGDADGVVVLPRKQLHIILPLVEEVLAAEGATQGKIKNGFTNLGGIEDLLASDRVRYVD